MYTAIKKTNKLQKVNLHGTLLDRTPLILETPNQNNSLTN